MVIKIFLNEYQMIVIKLSLWRGLFVSTNGPNKFLSVQQDFSQQRLLWFSVEATKLKVMAYSCQKALTAIICDNVWPIRN